MTISIPPSPAATLAVRLRRLARVVHALILAGAAAVVGGSVWAWTSTDRALAQVKRLADVDGLDHLTAQAQLLGGLSTLVPVGVLLLALQRLWALFGEYAKDRVFSRRALVCLRGFARSLLALAVLTPVHGALLSVIASWANGPGKRVLSIEVSSDTYLLLLFGAVVLAISTVMAEAARVAEDNAGFV